MCSTHPTHLIERKFIMENEKLAQDFIDNHDDVNLESTTNESDDNISNIIIPSIGLVSLDTSSDDFHTPEGRAVILEDVGRSINSLVQMYRDLISYPEDSEDFNNVVKNVEEVLIPHANGFGFDADAVMNESPLTKREKLMLLCVDCFSYMMEIKHIVTNMMLHDDTCHCSNCCCHDEENICNDDDEDDNKIFEMLSNELNGTVPDEYDEDDEYDNISD